MSSLLAIADARIDIDGVPTIDGLDFETTSDHVLVIGAARALFEAACGLRDVVRGSILLRGTTPADAVRSRAIAGASLDPPLPPKWTPLDYVTWSARLAGHAKSEAAANAKEALEKLELGPLAKKKIAPLVLHAKRACVIAAAMATGAQTILVEDPLAGLAEEAARAFATTLVAALEGRAWIVFAGRVALTSPLALAAEEVVSIDGTRIAAHGLPAEVAAAPSPRRFVARFSGSTEALAARLEERGVKLETDGERITIDLGDHLTTAELLGLSAESDVTILELFPVARALA